MHDPVAEILRQRAALGTGAGAGVAVSLMLHGGITALAIYAAMHATVTPPATTLNIRLAPVQSSAKAVAEKATPPAPPKQRIEEPKPAPPPTPVAKPVEKNTVPLSPFGQSTKKGSENPETRPRTDTAPPAPAAVTSTAPVVPVGGTGVTGIEGGDFPFTLYIAGMQKAISKNWYRPQGGADLTVVIHFRILRDGTIVDADYAKRSGNPTFDRQALSAVRSSSPLSPLPFAYNGTFLGVDLTFR